MSNSPALLAVEVAYSPRPGVVDCVTLALPHGATLADAVQASGLVQRHGLDLATLRCGVWCKVKDLGTVLRARDRVELYRPLLVDPKEARRLRYKRHRERLAAAQGEGAQAAAPAAEGAAGVAGLAGAVKNAAEGGAGSGSSGAALGDPA